MSFCRPLVVVVFVAMMISVIGCSGGSTPVVPDQNQATGSIESLPIIGLTQTGDGFSAIGLFGAYELQINPESMTADLISKRVPSLGESYIVSGIGFFTVYPCAGCLKLSSLALDPPYIKLTFDISHPFNLGDPTKPPTGRNRADLDIFDLAMIIVPTSATANTFTLGNIYSSMCGQVDGYTTELAGVTGDVAACPYYLVVDDSDGTTSTFNEFEMGKKNALFDVFFSGGGIFNMYLTMGYGKSAQKKADRFSPQYFNPEFNRKSAWKVVAIPPEGTNPPTRQNTWNNIATDAFDVTVKVWDWQQGANVDPTLANPTDVYVASGVSKVSIEIPGMTTTPVEITSPTSGAGTPIDPLIYTASIANTNHLAPGKYVSLVKVEDERVTLDPPPGTGDRDFVIDAPDGVTLTNYKIPAYVTYQTFTATVIRGCGPITGQIDTPATCPVTGVMDGQNLTFEGSASSANGGNPIASFEWDMDYDGTTFDVDGTGASVRLGPFDNPNCGGTNEPVDYTVALRVTDSCLPPNVQIVDTCVVTVDICYTPHIYSEDFTPKDTGDTWWDIAVAPDGPVYVCADHPATGNTDTKRTALMWPNDMTTQQVLNSGTGMNDPDFWLIYNGVWDRIDVIDGSGKLVTNPMQGTMAIWTVSGTAALDDLCCFRYICGWANVAQFADVWGIDDGGGIIPGPSGVGYCDFGQTCGYAIDKNQGALWMMDAITYQGGGILSEYWGTPLPFYNYYAIKGIKGIPGTPNALFFLSDTTQGRISISGDWLSDNYTSGSPAPVEISTYGVLGTADEEFTGGLDVALDSANNIVTLENHSGLYRFQKFSLSGTVVTWIYSSWWIDSGDPQRMDFDTADDQLYLLCNNGVHICHVD